MKKVLFSFCIAFIAITFSINFQSIAQDNSKNDLKSKIDKIKAQYKEIKSMESSLKKRSINMDSDFEVSSLDIYSLKNETKKCVYSVAGEDCGESYEVYYNQNKPFFVLLLRECFVNEETVKTEERYYFENGKLIQYIAGKQTIKENSEQFQQDGAGILSVLDSISDLIKKK